MKNDILEDVWRSRDEFARRHNYSLDAMVEELRKMERYPWNTVVDRRSKTPNKRLDTDASSRRR